MADIIRDAIIRLSIQQGETKIQAPDLTKVLEARRREIELTKESKQLAIETAKAKQEAIDGVAQAQRKAEAAARKRITAVVSQGEKAVNAANAEAARLRDVEASLRAVIKAGQERQRAEEAARKSRMATEVESLKNLQSLLGSIEQVADGFFLIARASALLGAGSDKDLRKMLENLAKVQAAWDLFKGTSTIIRATIDRLVLLKEAQIASGLATDSHTIAMVIQTAVMAKLRAAAALLIATLGPIGAAIAVTTALVWLAVKAWQFFTDTTEADAEAKEKHEARMQKFDAKRAARVKAEIDAVGRQQKANEKLRSFAGDGAELKALRSKQDARELALDALDREQKVVEGMRLTSQRALNEQKQALEVISAKRSAVLADTERQNQLEKSIATSAAEKVKSVRAALELRKKELKTAKDALEVEENKTKSLKAQFASLNAVERAELKRLDKKFKDGTATLQDARRVDEGGFGSFLGDQARDIKAGSADALGFGGLSASDPRLLAEKEARQNVARGSTNLDRTKDDAQEVAAEAGVETLGDSVDDTLDALDSAEETLKDNFKRYLDDNADLLSQAITQQEQLKTKIDEIDIAVAGGGR